MRIWLILLLYSIGICSSLPAQSLSPAVVASNGGIDQAAGLQLEWTLGEPAIEQLNGQNRNYSEGFHQPLLVIEQVDIAQDDLGQNALSDIDDVITLAPNPVSSELIIDFRSVDAAQLQLTLFDASGGLLLHQQINTLDGQAKIDLADYAPGLYVIQFTTADASVKSTFKITKIQ